MKYTKEQLDKMPDYRAESKSSSALIQNLEILSSGANLVRVIGSVPGAVGYSPDGEITFEYSPQSHSTHTLAENAIVDINHHGDEVIGSILKSESDADSNLIVDLQFPDKYSYFAPIMEKNLHDGVSIESVILSGKYITDTRVLVTKYILTGIAVMMAKPPACDKEICRVISGAPTDFHTHDVLHDLTVKIDTMSDADLKETLANIKAEAANRKNAPTDKTD